MQRTNVVSGNGRLGQRWPGMTQPRRQRRRRDVLHRAAQAALGADGQACAQVTHRAGHAAGTLVARIGFSGHAAMVGQFAGLMVDMFMGLFMGLPVGP